MYVCYLNYTEIITEILPLFANKKMSVTWKSGIYF
jgi:hypothetical protein